MCIKEEEDGLNSEETLYFQLPWASHTGEETSQHSYSDFQEGSDC